MSEGISEIETIVRLVVERLQAMVVAAPLANSTVPPSEPHTGPQLDHKQTSLKQIQDPTRLIISRSLVTMEQLHGRSLKDIRIVEVGRRAVVTPAVKDELRLRGIQLKRAMPTYPAIPQTEILLIASAAKSLRHSRIVAEQVELSSDSAAETAIAHLTAPERCVVWCSRTPYAAHQAVCRYHKARASLLPGLNDLPRAQQEVNPNVLVLDDRRWSLADLNTLVQQWQVET